MCVNGGRVRVRVRVVSVVSIVEYLQLAICLSDFLRLPALSCGCLVFCLVLPVVL